MRLDPSDAMAPTPDEGSPERGGGDLPAPQLDFASLPPVPGGGSSLGAEWWIALGHLRSKKSETFLSLVTLFSVVGVMAGVAMLNWVIAVMTGFEVDLRNKILGANAHVVVFRYGGNLVDYEALVDEVLTVDGVKAASPFVYHEMMIKSPWSATGVVVKGMDPARSGDVTHVRTDLVEGYLFPPPPAPPAGEPAGASLPDLGRFDRVPLVGELDDPASKQALLSALGGELPGVGLDGAALITENEPMLPGILIGTELRDQLQVGIGDKVHLINPLGGGTGPMGVPTPSVRSVRVAGVFSSGMYEYDTKWTYVSNAFAQSFLKIGDTVNGIEITVDDIDDVERISHDIDEVLGYPHYARHWQNLNAKLFAALQLEKWVMGLLLQMIVVVAGLLIVTTLFMQVLTKGREIAILKAMGATSGSILRIFVFQGAVIGLLGTTLGTALGLLGCEFLRRYEYPLETDVYFLSTLPVVVDAETVVAIAVSALAICFVCTIYPAWRASLLDPVEALRYE